MWMINYSQVLIIRTVVRQGCVWPGLALLPSLQVWKQPLSHRYLLDTRSNSTALSLLSPWFCPEYLWWVASYLLPGSRPCFPAASNCPHAHLQTEAHSSVTEGDRRWSQKGFKKERESFYFAKRETMFGEESYLCTSFSASARVGRNFPSLSFFSSLSHRGLHCSACHREVSSRLLEVSGPWNCEICHTGVRYVLLTSQEFW